MIQLDNFLADVNTEEERPNNFKEENAVTTLKEQAELVDALFLNITH